MVRLVKLPLPPVDELINLLKHKTAGEIAAEYHVRRDAVYQKLHRHQIRLRAIDHTQPQASYLTEAKEPGKRLVKYGRVIPVRFYDEELEALKILTKRFHLNPSEILRKLVREAAKDED